MSTPLDNSVSRAVGIRLRMLREEHRLKQGEFGSRLGIPPQNVSRYEGGRRLPSAETLVRIHKEFHVNIHWLLTGAGFMQDGATAQSSNDPEIQEIVDWARANEAVRGALLLLKEERLRPFVEKHAPHLLADLERNISKAG